MLEEKGCQVTTPTLLGHATSLEELSRVKTYQWLEQVEDTILPFVKRNEKFTLIGQSFGSLLSLYIAEKFSENVESCVLLAPPLLFKSKLLEFFLFVFSFLPESLVSSFGTVKKSKREQGQFVEERHDYKSHSVAAILRLVKIRRMVMAQLSKIKARLLLIQDPNDHHLDIRGLKVITDNINKSLVFREEFLLGASHEISIGRKQKEAFKIIKEFLCLER